MTTTASQSRRQIDRLTKELFAHFDESARLEQVVRVNLERLDG